MKAIMRRKPERPIRLVYVLTSLAMGGAQQVVLALLNSPLSKAYPALLVTLVDVPGLQATARALGIQEICLDLKHPWRTPARLYQLVRQLWQQDVQLIYSALHHANLFAVLLAWVLSFKQRPALIWSLHDTPIAHLYTRWQHRALFWLTQRWSSIPDRIVVVSERSRQRYVELTYPAQTMVLIPNGIAVSSTPVKQLQYDRLAVRHELGVPLDAIFIGSLTRAVPEKDLPNLLAAFALLAAQYPKLYLVLAGEGIEHSNPALKAQLASLHLGNRVQLLGLRQDAKRLIRSFDIATLASRSESLPLFLAEAMAEGIPCVATDVGDIRLLLADTGKLVPASDPAALARGWQVLLALEPWQRESLGQQAKQRIAESFSENTMLQQHADLFATYTN